eukprot:1157076-Pelagomonas_calceolata.AAC.4
MAAPCLRSVTARTPLAAQPWQSTLELSHGCTMLSSIIAKHPFGSCAMRDEASYVQKQMLGAKTACINAAPFTEATETRITPDTLK